jgi:glycosyltransferase involved in cell wall biosynthesis
MRIVHVEDFFHPDAGYQVNLLSRLQKMQGHDVTVVTAELEKMPSFLTAFFGTHDLPAKDEAFERETGVRVIRVPLLGFYSGRAIFRPLRLFREVSALKPDVVFVHGEDTLTGILFIWLSKRLRYPIVLDCHMLEMASLNRFRKVFRAFYRRFVTPIILREKIPLMRVVNSDYVQSALGIPLSYTDLMSFGTDTTHFRPDPEAGRKVRAEYGFREDSFLVLYAGKLDEHKGGRFLAESIQERLAATRHSAIELLVIGNTDGDYGKEVEALIGRSANRVVRLPTQRYFDLARFYQAADLAVFPRQCSMSFFEAQSCGVPILFEENEINSQRASEDNAFLFRPENAEDFRRQIEWMESLPPERYAEIRRNARDYVLRTYDYVPIAQKFTDVLRRAIDAWQRKPELQ